MFGFRMAVMISIELLRQLENTAQQHLLRSGVAAACEFIAQVVASKTFERFANHPPAERTQKGEAPVGLPLAVLLQLIAHGLNPILLFKASVAKKQLQSRAGDPTFNARDYAQVQAVFNDPQLLECDHKSKRYVYSGIGTNGKKYKAVIEVETSRWVLVSFHRLPK